jgi:hypothetical protein
VRSNFALIPLRSRDSSVGIAAGYRLDGRGSVPDRGKIFVYSTATSSPLGPPQPPVQWVPRALYTGVKRPELEADHLAKYGAEVKNGGAIPPLPLMSSWHGA